MNKYQKERFTAAIEYAQRGWKVLPVGLNKKPINYNGSLGATTDIKQITDWWSEHPFANLGIATGRESFWVVDIDMKDGTDGLGSLNSRFGDRFSFDTKGSLWAKTPTGGFHFLFNYPTDRTVNNAQSVLKGVDIRGDGGYIVVAPSARKIGDKYEPYRWYDYSLPVADSPEWALELLSMQKDKVSAGVDIERVMTGGLTEGERDTELFRYACHLASKNVPIDIAIGFINVAAERCKPPFDRDVAEEKVRSAYKYQSQGNGSRDVRPKVNDTLARIKQVMSNKRDGGAS